MDTSQSFIRSDDSVYFSGNAGEKYPVGYALSAFKAARREVTQRGLATPTVIGPIPNPDEFSNGPDLFGNARLIRKPKSESTYALEIFRPFIPVIQMALNFEHAYFGNGQPEKRWVTIRPSRHTTVPGFAHQPEFSGRHNHAGHGAMSVYIASDTYPTGFPSLTVPENHVIRFDEKAYHWSQIMTQQQRRTMVIISFYEDEPDRRNQHDTHRFEPDGGHSEKTVAWRAATAAHLARVYPAKDQERDLTEWGLRNPTGPIKAKPVPLVFN
jgi:hypothetical protein